MSDIDTDNARIMHREKPRKSQKRMILRHVCLGISILSLLALASRYLYHDYKHGTDWFRLEGILILEALLITWLTRSIPTMRALQFFSRGIWLCMGITLLLGQGLYWHVFGIDPKLWWMSGIYIPILEEAVKVLPVVLAIWWGWRRTRTRFTGSDIVVMALLCGAGFDIVEKMFYPVGVKAYDFVYGPAFGGFHFFQDALGVSMGRHGSMGFIGHAAAAGFTALGIALGEHIKRLKFARGNYWWWVLPLLCFSWVVLEHGLYNLRQQARDYLDYIGRGQWTPWIFVVLLAIVILVDLVQGVRALIASRELRRTWRYVLSFPLIMKRRGKEIGIWNLLTWPFAIRNQMYLTHQVAGCLGQNAPVHTKASKKKGER